MRPALLALLLLAAAAPAASASNDDGGSSPGGVTEIRLGEAPPPPPTVDRSRVNVVERYLASRQEGSLARSRGSAVKVAAMGPKGAKAEELYGPKGARLVAFDFESEAIEPAGSGRFQVPVYLLFADDAGQVVESRDETLAFTACGGSWCCASRTTSASIAWNSDQVLSTAESLGVSDEFRKACAHLSDWTAGRDQGLAYSVADIAKERDGRVVVQCLRFTAALGHRGYDVSSAPLVLSRDGGVLRIESN